MIGVDNKLRIPLQVILVAGFIAGRTPIIGNEKLLLKEGKLITVILLQAIITIIVV